jgi:(2R)-3-sulfolactate dehydrogenase (NADP+)
MSDVMTMSLDEARTRAAATLMASGAGELAAASVAHALVLAQADGMGGHGLMRLASYAAQVRAGKVDGNAKPRLSFSLPGAIAVDAANGFAYPALDLAVDRLTEAARSQGIAFAGVRRSGHCGAMGLFVETLARAGLVALMVANSPAAMAAWGGQRALFGTNPIACAFPYREDPVLIDLSLSKVARGHVVAASKKGAAIPDDWALDAHGHPTTDAVAALAGTMLPAGGAKGASLALMVEALAAGVAGANFAFNASSFLDDKGPAPGTGQLLIALVPDAVGGSTGHLAELFAAIEAEPGARLPGARRFSTRRSAERNGIAVEPGWFNG